MNKSEVFLFNLESIPRERLPHRAFVAMVNFADDRGIVWAKTKEIAEFMDMSIRTLMKDIATLQELDVVRRYRDMVYIMNPSVVRSDINPSTMKPITTTCEEMWGEAR